MMVLGNREVPGFRGGGQGWRRGKAGRLPRRLTRLELLDERRDLRVRRQPELLTQEHRVHARMLNGAGGIAYRRERLHEAERYTGIVRVAAGKPPPVQDRSRKIGRPLTVLGHLFQRLRISARITSSLGIQPALELGCVADVKALEEVAAIELYRIGDATI